MTDDESRPLHDLRRALSPTIAVSAQTGEAELQRLIAALQSAEGLPASLEVIQLDEDSSLQAEAGRAETRIVEES